MTRTNVFFTIIIAVLIILCSIFWTAYKTQRQLNSNNVSIINEIRDSIRYSRTETGRERAEKLAAQATAKQFQEAYPAFAAQLSREFDVKIKDVKAFIRNEFIATGQGEGRIDTIHVDHRDVRTEARIADRYLRASIQFMATGEYRYMYTYSDSITTVLHTKKKWFLGKETLYTTSSLQNPNARVKGSTSVLVSNYRDKRFVIYIGAGYDPFNNRPVVSAGLGYALFKF